MIIEIEVDDAESEKTVEELKKLGFNVADVGTDEHEAKEKELMSDAGEEMKRQYGALKGNPEEKEEMSVKPMRFQKA